ncbi:MULTISPECIES: TRAP transporter small permease [Brevibacterium]|jgi:C4-dicarboxylate transporter DctQ subunit|uniref:TRAP transporter small permease n=1 Tax=Brevibacterium salitolerans TaxID=1403566 RepID=A0ABP5ICA2_9MICO|nr:TRAP transporter small permease subunit [Brevibacterium sp.]
MFDKTLTLIENTLIAVSFFVITMVAFVNVVARYVFHGSLSFTGELIVNLAVLLTLVGASAVTRQGSHPSFSLLRDSLRGLPRTLVIVGVCAAMLVFYALFLWVGADMAEKQAASGRLTPALGFPQWIFSLALPFGALLGAVRAIQVAVIALRGGETFVSEEEAAVKEAEDIRAHEEATQP